MSGQYWDSARFLSKSITKSKPLNSSQEEQTQARRQLGSADAFKNDPPKEIMIESIGQKKKADEFIIEEESVEAPAPLHETARELLNKEVFPYMIDQKEPQSIIEIPTLTIDPNELNEPVFLAQKLLKIGIENIGAIKIVLPSEVLPKFSLNLKNSKKLNVVEQNLQNFSNGKVILKVSYIWFSLSL